VNNANVSAGIYNCSVNVVSPGNSGGPTAASINNGGVFPIQLVVSSQPCISVSPLTTVAGSNPLANFAFTLGSTVNPTAQTVTISDNSPTASALTVNCAGGCPAWLVLGTPSGSPSFSSPATVSVGVNPAAVPNPGSYTATVTVTGAGATLPPSFTVTFNVIPGLTATPTTLNFGTFTQSSQPPLPTPQTVTATLLEGTSAAYTLTGVINPGTCTGLPAGSTNPPPNWLMVTQTGASFQVQVNSTVFPTLAAPAICTGSLTISGAGPNPAPASVIVTPITFTLVSLGGPSVSPIPIPAFTITNSYPVSVTPVPVTVASTVAGAPSVPYTVTVTPISGGNWLTTSATSGMSPGGFTLSVAPTANTLAATGPNTPYLATVTIAEAGTTNTTPITLPVQLFVNPQATLSVTGTVSFPAHYRQFTIPGSSPLSVTTTDGLTPATPSNFAVNITQPPNAAGLFTFATPGGTTTTGTGAGAPIAVSYSAAVANAITPGTYNGSLTVTVGGTTNPGSVTIPLNLTINAEPTLTTVPSGLTGVAFGVVLGGPAPAPQTMTVISVQNIPFSVVQSSLPSWLTVSPTSGTANVTSLTLTPSTAGLPVGTFAGQVVLSSPSSSNSPSVPASLVIVNPSVIFQPTTQPVFTGPWSGAASPSWVLTFTSNGVMPTLAVAGVPSWLTVAISGQTVSLTTNPAGLNPGTYSATLAFTATPAQNNPILVTVTFTVTSPIITVTPVTATTTGLTFTGIIGGTAPAAQTLTFTSASGTPTLSVSGAPSWLTVGISGLTATVSASPTNLTPGTYTATLAFVATPGANNPISVPVTFTVMPQIGCLVVTTASGALTAAGTSTGGFTPNVPASVTVSHPYCPGITVTSSAPLWLSAAATTSGFSYQALSNSNSTARTGTITLTVGTGVPATGGGTLVFPVSEAGDSETLLPREVRALYASVLGRDPDAGGFAFWTGTGSAGLGQMLDSFLTSPEALNSDFAVMAAYQGATGAPPTYAQFTATVAGIRSGTETIGGLYSSLTPNGFTAQALYLNLLNRAPTGPEILAFNVDGALATFTTLIASPEFQSTTNGLYIRMLYFVILGRDPDFGGLDFWVGVANSGGPGILFQSQAGYATRIQILGTGAADQGFSGSPEFQGKFR